MVKRSYLHFYALEITFVFTPQTYGILGSSKHLRENLNAKYADQINGINLFKTEFQLASYP